MPRFAAPIAEQDFRSKLEDAIQKHPDFDRAEMNDDDDIISYPNRYIIRNLNSDVRKDLSKCEFDSENFECTSEAGRDSRHLLGIHTRNGVTFLGCESGGDWEFAVYFIIYWDGKGFRGYFPAANFYNKKLKAAFGNDHTEEIDAAEGYDMTRHNDYFDGLYDRILADIDKRIKIR